MSPEYNKETSRLRKTTTFFCCQNPTYPVTFLFHGKNTVVNNQQQQHRSKVFTSKKACCCCISLKSCSACPKNEYRTPRKSKYPSQKLAKADKKRTKLAIQFNSINCPVKVLNGKNNITGNNGNNKIEIPSTVVPFSPNLIPSASLKKIQNKFSTIENECSKCESSTTSSFNEENIPTLVIIDNAKKVKDLSAFDDEIRKLYLSQKDIIVVGDNDDFESVSDLRISYMLNGLLPIDSDGTTSCLSY